METFNATVIEEEGKYFINIVDSSDIPITKIPISEDEPNTVKASFNSLINSLKQGMFIIKMTGINGSLYSQVSNEYINQLNREIEEVYKEMVHYDLLTSE